MSDGQSVIRSVERGTPTVVAYLAGDLDDLIGAGHTDQLVDLAAVTYADSTGLTVLVDTLKKARRREVASS